MNSMGDFSRSEYYHSKAMTEFYQLELSKKKSLSDWPDFILKVWLPHFTSRFGQKVARPVFLLLYIHTVAVALLIIIQGLDFGIELSRTSINTNLYKAVNLWAYTILPTHRLAYEGGTIIPIISLMMRIVNSILIYQIVQASRKHLKGMS